MGELIQFRPKHAADSLPESFKQAHRAVRKELDQLIPPPLSCAPVPDLAGTGALHLSPEAVERLLSELEPEPPAA